MLLKVNKAVLYFIIICFIATVIPYIFYSGHRMLFVRDFLAKRIMTLFSLPFFALVLFWSFKKNRMKLNKNIVFYLISFCIIFVNSIFYRNSILLIGLDSFIVFLPVFFYLLVYKASYNFDHFSKHFPFFLIMACLMVVSYIKLQFSYFSMLGILYIIFIAKVNFNNIILYLFLPTLVVNTLIGKSALLMLSFLILYFFLFDKKLVSKKKKAYLILIPTALIIIGTIVFWDYIKQTGAYINTTYFLRHADFENFKFSDMSTGHRIYEAQRVLEEFQNSNIYSNLFGNGLGATIDLSDTNDVAVTNSNSDLTKVRHIHIGFFAVLHRFGLLGLIIYLSFIFKLVKCCRRVLSYSNNYVIVLSALYALIMLFDSFISFPHMMSNFMFWLIAFLLFYESDRITRIFKS